MRKVIVVVVLLSLLDSCTDSGNEITTGLPELPEVVATQTNYMPSTIHNYVPNATILQRFTQACINRYSQDLKMRLMSYIEQKAANIGLSRNELRTCIQVTGQQEPSAISLPYRAERARYDSHQCWLLEFTCSHTSPGELGHYRCFVIDVLTYDTLLYITCR